MSNDKLTIIIPVHELTEDTSILFGKALNSIKTQKVQPGKVMVVAPKNEELIDKIKSIALENEVTVDIVENEGNTNFAGQINRGVYQLDTKYFSILEYDDEFTPIWVGNVTKYIDENPEVDMFLPIIVDVTSEGEYIGFTNEPVWANEFSSKLGEIDNPCALRYSNFSIDGMVMSKEKYDEFGGLKESMELVFPYEFLLRVTNFSGRVMVIPKLGYKHVSNREGSLFSTYSKDMSIDERRWWLALAKKEYFHTNDRSIKYVQ